jgi:hypothetical protein
MDVILDLLWFGFIFSVLGLAPLVTWLAISWLATDRQRTSRRPDAT